MLEIAQRFNPHGCGFCTPTKEYKGLTFRSFLKRIQEVGDEPVLIHFRYATHGSVKRSNCHPFYDSVSDTHFMHNGVLNIYPQEDITDSEYAFRNFFVPDLRKYGLHSNELKEDIYHNIGSSRFAFMQGEEVRLYGDFRKIDRCFYSNTRFL